MLTNQQAIEIIKKTPWELRVTRAGYLQSKQIVDDALVLPNKLTPNITVGYTKILWIKDLYLNDDVVTKSFPEAFARAYAEDPAWPIKLSDTIDALGAEAEKAIKKFATLKADSSIPQMIAMLQLYRTSLMNLQKYYVVAVPMTNYAEAELIAHGFDAASFGVPLRKLDVSKIAESKDPKKDYAWLKTAYNMVEELTEKDIQQLKETEGAEHHVTIPKTATPHQVALIHGLQAGIYNRNRMKELAQKLWYYFNEPAAHMAAAIGISRDDFFCLTVAEAIESLEKKTCVVSAAEIANRKMGFVIANFDGEAVLISGKPAVDILADYQKPQAVSELKGSVACRGFVTGTARLIFNMKQSANFKEGEILVTTMTTPDFTILLKKAAAIVTDEGGLSCHAAIVSREMNIPCVIGTKIATKSIKDGDKIEVDAIKGIVRKL